MGAAHFAAVFTLVLLIVLAGWCAAMPGGLRRRLAQRALQFLKPGRRGARGPDAPRLRLNLKATRLDILAGRILPNPEHWRRQLERTGSGWSLGTFGGIAAATCLGTVLATTALRLPAAACWGVGLLAGLYVPRFLVQRMIRKRSAKFIALLPDAIGLLVRGVRSGLPITEAVVTIGREMPGPVGEEFRKITDHIQLGQPLEEVMWQAAKRLDLAEFTFMCITFSIQRETGGNLAETLENLEQLLRRRKQMQLKIRAFSSEARASSGIIGSLPFLMLTLLSVVNWSYVRTLFSTHSGNLLLAAAAGSLLLGIAALKKLGNFEI